MTLADLLDDLERAHDAFGSGSLNLGLLEARLGLLDRTRQNLGRPTPATVV